MLSYFFIYKRFIENEIRPFFNESIIYQKIPTFRTQVPNNLSVAEWHKDSDYSHSRSEVNIFLPLTSAHDDATVWTESKEGKEDYLKNGKGRKSTINAVYFADNAKYVWMMIAVALEDTYNEDPENSDAIILNTM